MRDEEKPRNQLIGELVALRQRIAELEAVERNQRRDEEALRNAYDDVGQQMKERAAQLLKTDEQLRREILERKEAEEALQDSEERFRTFMETAGDLMHVADKEGNFIYVNNSMARTLGYSKEEMLGMHITQVLSKETLEEYFEPKLEELILKGEIRLETTWATKEGREIFGEVKVVAIYDGEGKFAGSRGVFRDLTERKRTEKALREKEEEWRTLVENAPGIILKIDQEGTIQFINRTVPGYTVEDTIGKSVYDYILSDYHELTRQAIEQVFKTGDIVSLEIMGAGPRGTPSWYSNRLGPIKRSGEVVAVAQISTDITQRKQAEEMLRIRDWALESSINGIAFADLQGNLTYVNDSLVKMWGYDNSEDVVGRPAVEFWETPENAQSVIEALRERGAWMGELVARRKDGSLFHVHLSASMITDEANKAILMMGTFVDISTRKRAEAELQESQDRYRRLVETMNEGLGVQDENGLITYVNDKLCKMWGYSQDEIIGRPVTDFLDKANQAIFIEQMAGRRNGERTSYELLWTAKDGRKIPTIMSPEPFFNTRGHFKGSFAVITDISELKKVEQALRGREKELEIKSRSLEEVNAALRVLLKRMDEDRIELEEKVLFNVKDTILPFLEKLNTTRLDAKQKTYVDLLKSNINNIIAPFSRDLSSKYSDLTLSQIQIANLISDGKTSKEIAQILNLSPRTIDTQRQRIRKKIGITHKTTDLRSHLLSLR